MMESLPLRQHRIQNSLTQLNKWPAVRKTNSTPNNVCARVGGGILVSKINRG